jgi:hypothetical protein
MAVTVQQFRTAFPEFGNAVKYPDAQVQFYLDLAQGNEAGLQGFIGPRWGTKAPYGAQLFVAHNLSIEGEAQKLAAKGQNPGQVLGPIASGSVDKVSYTRSLQDILNPGAGHWNMTVYGMRYWQLMRMVGAGPVQVGPSCGAGAVYPWAGPLFPPSYP